MTINENIKLSRNRKRRHERRIKIDDKLKTTLNKITAEKRKKSKKIDEIKELEIELVKIIYANKPKKLQSELKDLNKIVVIDKNLHEIKSGILLDYVGEFEMVGCLKVGDQTRQTHIRFRKMDDFEAYNNAIDEGYDAEDAIFNGYKYKLNTPQFKKKTEVNMEMDVISNMKLLKIKVISVLYQQKSIVSLNVLIF